MSHNPAHIHSISKKEIMDLPIKKYTGDIHVIDSDAKMPAAVLALGREKVLGFDTETRPSFKVGESYPPSLIQLASRDGAYIFQLSHIRAYDGLVDILGDEKRVKVGIAVADDIKKLKSLFAFEPEGFIELAGLAVTAGIKHAGIRGLAALLFGCRISKSTKCSRWDTPILTREQIVYAATDAWICREIYFELRKRNKEINKED